MTANVGLAPVVAVLLVALAGASVISAEAREDTDCLAAPGAQAPPGRHWFYRIDRSKQRKCWYLRAQSAAAATARAPMRHRLRIASAAPEARLPSPSDQLVPEIRLEPQAGPPVAAADEQTAPASINDGVQALRSTEADIATAPVVSAPVISDASAAPGPRPSDDPAATVPRGAAEGIRQAHAVRMTAAQPDERARDAENGGEEVAEPMPTVTSGHVAALAFVFAGAMLIIAGIFLHPIIQVFARRPVFRTEGTEPVSGFFGRRRDAALRKRELRLDEI